MTRKPISQIVEHWDPAGDPDGDAQLVARAIMLGRTRTRTAQRRMLGVAALSIAAVFALFVSGRATVHDFSRSPSTTFALSGGDGMTVVEGTDFGMLPAQPSQVRIRLTRGAILFDVQSRTAGEAFEVVTPTATVRVIGTVFAVEVDDDGRTSVDVFEGRVEVRDRRGARRLGAHESERADDANLIDSLHALGRARATARENAREQASDPEPPEAMVDGTTAREPAPRETSAETGASPVHTPSSVSASSDSSPTVGPERAPSRNAERDITAEELRSAIAHGEGARVLDALPTARVSERDRAWLRADALRALGRSDDAIEAYRTIVDRNDPEQQIAAYIGARLLLQTNRPDEALRMLDRARSTTRDSSLRERVLALRGRALHATGNEAALRVVAHDYLTQFPTGATADWMRSIVD